MDLCLQVILNEFKPVGIVGTGNVWVEFFFKFISHSQATGLGLAAD
jgi:hypothetical protein